MTLDSGSQRRENREMTMAPETHTCPFCELVFSYHNEIKDHILRDHPLRAETVAGIDPHEIPHG